MRIGSIIIFHLSKLWKAKFFILCDVIFWWGCSGNLKLITVGSERVRLSTRPKRRYMYLVKIIKAWTATILLTWIEADPKSFPPKQEDTLKPTIYQSRTDRLYRPQTDRLYRPHTDSSTCSLLPTETRNIFPSTFGPVLKRGARFRSGCDPTLLNPHKLILVYFLLVLYLLCQVLPTVLHFKPTMFSQAARLYGLLDAVEHLSQA